MQALLRFLKTYELGIYLLLGVAFLLYFRRLLLAWRVWQGALFGLEREEAERRLRGAFLGVVLSVGLMLTTFALVTFATPVQTGPVVLPTATLDLLATTPPEEASPTPEGTPTPLPTPVLDTGGCVPDQVFIASPQTGDTISGEVTIEGTANIPNFGFYKVEFALASEALFLTIGVGRVPRVQEPLIEGWDTSRIPPGDYVIQLVVTDNQGQALPPCRVRVHIAAPPAQP
ncbi:MAG TPA: hypothetical protein G4O04_06485 [Anaerolineae bacterium]|nr:hypothetical protein [Anaerolineae bacterium]HID84196.1 hypothetical protein [Anaerolineales bacterium]HIQ08290.1 hypothetical protein [Anaerolineaceae bacterium]